MNEIINKLKELNSKCDELIKKEVGYTLEEIVRLEGEEFEKASDKLVEVMSQVLGLEDKVKKVKDIKEEDIKEKANGNYFKVYDAETNDTEGVVVRANGNIADVLFMSAKGIGSIIRDKAYMFNDIDELVNEIKDIILNEAKKGGNR